MNIIGDEMVTGIVTRQLHNMNFENLIIVPRICTVSTEAEFLDEIQAEILRVFLLAIHSHLYIVALRFLFLQTHTTSYSFYSSDTVHCKGGKPDGKQYHLPYSLRNPYRILKSEQSQDYTQKPQRNCIRIRSKNNSIYFSSEFL